MSAMSDWFRRQHYFQRHFERYERYVKSLRPKLVCQECGGRGGETIPVLDYGQGPWEHCGWCEGTGLVTRHRRGEWLRYRRESA